MSEAEIIAQLPKLSRDEPAEVQDKLDELMGETWHQPVSDLLYSTF